MRVALFVETYFPFINGVVTHIKVLRDGLTQLGHEVLVVAADPTAKKHYVKDGVLHCPAHAMKRLYGFGLANPQSRTRMKILEDFNPDVLHMHQEFGIGYFAQLASKRLHKPLVYTLHTMYDEYIFYVAPKPMVPAVRRASHVYVKKIARTAAAITSPSRKAQEYFDKCGIQKKVEIIPNSVEVEQFDPANFTPDTIAAIRKKLGIQDGYHAAVFVGRLGREKSVDVLIDWWAKYFTPEDKMHLVVIGDGPEMDALKAQAAGLGIADSVTFTGRVEHSDIAPYFSACDLYISASLTEMMSISMLEGMAAGLPIVQRYDELNAAQIEEGVNGYNYHTPEEMADTVRMLTSQSPEEKAEMKQRVRQTVLTKGSTDLARYMLGVYSRVTGIPVED